MDTIIERLLSGTTTTAHTCIDTQFIVRTGRPGKAVNLEEAEIRWLCERSRQVFLSQPILLELEAPIKICGTPFFMIVIFIYINTHTQIE